MTFCILGNIFLLLEIFFVFKNHKKIKNYIKNNILEIFFILLCLGLYIWVKNAMLYGWDEFFWGQLAKFIHKNGSFWVSNSAVLPISSQYPPGAPIIQNIFMPFGNFNETAIFYANIFPFLCLLTLVTGLINKKKTKIKSKIFKIITVVLGTLCLSLYFGLNYPCYGNTDFTLEIIFTAGLLIVFFLPTKLRNIYLILPILSLLILLKPVGFLLALATITISFLRYLIELRQKKKKILTTWKSLLLILIFTALAFSPYFIWNEYVKKENLIVMSASTTNWELLNDAFITKNSERYKKTWANFYKDSITRPFNNTNQPSFFPKWLKIQDTLVNWIVALIVSFVLIIYLKKKNKEKIFKDTISYLVLFGGLFGWILFYMFMWLIVFGEYEGTVLASYERYLSVFLMAIAVLFFITIIQKIKSIKMIIILFFTIILASIYYRSSIFTMIKRPIKNFDPKRNEITVLANDVKNTIKSGNQIYYIHQNSNGLETMIFRYEMSPNNRVQYWGWSLGDKYIKTNVWKVVTSIEQLESTLVEYDYIVLGKIDSDFTRLYSKLFNPTNKLGSVKIWKITKNKNGIIINPATP
jgi:hypothetical protein